MSSDRAWHHRHLIFSRVRSWLLRGDADRPEEAVHIFDHDLAPAMASCSRRLDDGRASAPRARLDRIGVHAEKPQPGAEATPLPGDEVLMPRVPVPIFGHSSGEKQTGMFLVAATMAKHGIATIGINAVGHGFGPLGTLMLRRAAGGPISIPAGGRGIDTNNDGQITST